MPEVAQLSAAAFERGLDLRWRRTSYSDITAAVHEAWVTSEPEEPLIGDEPPAAEAVATAVEDGVTDGGQPLALAAMPVGAEVGTFVHRVLEATDFAAADLAAELGARIDEVQATAQRRDRRPGRGRDGTRGGDRDAARSGARRALAARLRARATGSTSSGFELPLAGGDQPHGWAELSGLAATLDQLLPAGDPLAGYARRLRTIRLCARASAAI